MKSIAEPLISVRAGPRPDPIPIKPLSFWTWHAPWVFALVALTTAIALLDTRDLGMLACGGGVVAVLLSAARAWLRTTAQAAHLAGGVITLTCLRSPEEAGSFVIAASMLTVGVLAGRAWAMRVRPQIAPLAGRLPWQFRASFRSKTVEFGVSGLILGLVVALFGHDPYLRVVGVAMFPLALRSYIGHLLDRQKMRAIWCLALAAHLAILGFFVPEYGAIAAAWGVVVCETILFAGAALVVARRTGVTPLPMLQLGGFACAAILVLILTIPHSWDWTLLAGIGLGIATGAFFLPRKSNS